MVESGNIPPDAYGIPQKKGDGLYTEKGSRFISIAYFVDSVEKAKEYLESAKKKYHDSRHVCFAYKIGFPDFEERAFDAGEPNYSAGEPILNQIRALELTNTLVMVVRYFGGTKLGVGGLKQAYKEAARLALESAGVKEVFLMDQYLLEGPFSLQSEVYRLIESMQASIEDQQFSTGFQLKVGIRKRDSQILFLQLESIKHKGLNFHLIA